LLVAKREVETAVGESGGNPKEALVDMISRTVTTVADAAGMCAEERQVRAELETMKISALKTRAEEQTISTTLLSEADDAENPKQALIDLCVEAMEMPVMPDEQQLLVILNNAKRLADEAIYRGLLVQMPGPALIDKAREEGVAEAILTAVLNVGQLRLLQSGFVQGRFKAHAPEDAADTVMAADPAAKDGLIDRIIASHVASKSVEQKKSLPVTGSTQSSRVVSWGRLLRLRISTAGSRNCLVLQLGEATRSSA
jgi:hypothetical protein